MPLPLPRSRLALGTLAGCIVAGVLIVAAAFVTSGRVPAGPTIGGPFALIDQDGRSVTQADFTGHPFIVFFGYTHCPDVCPTTLSDMTEMLQALGDKEPIEALFITVDPERDTPAVLKAYLSSFDPRIRGLTGDLPGVQAAEKAYRVYAKKVPAKDGGYSMDHTAVVYLMDGTGRFVSALNLEQSPQAAAAALKHDL